MMNTLDIVGPIKPDAKLSSRHRPRFCILRLDLKSRDPTLKLALKSSQIQVLLFCPKLHQGYLVGQQHLNAAINARKVCGRNGDGTGTELVCGVRGPRLGMEARREGEVEGLQCQPSQLSQPSQPRQGGLCCFYHVFPASCCYSCC